MDHMKPPTFYSLLQILQYDINFN